MDDHRWILGPLRGGLIAAFHLVCGLVLLTLVHVPQPLLSPSLPELQKVGGAVVAGLVLGTPGFLLYFAATGAAAAQVAAAGNLRRPLSALVAATLTVAALLVMGTLSQKLSFGLLTSGFAPALIFGGPVPVAITAAFAAMLYYWDWPRYET